MMENLMHFASKVVAHRELNEAVQRQLSWEMAKK